MKFILLLLILLLAGCENKKDTQNDNIQNLNTSKLSIMQNVETNHLNTIYPSPTNASPIKLSTFTTTIYTKTEERQNNVRITCDKLNGKIVNPRRNFFFYRYFRASHSRRRISKSRYF